MSDNAALEVETPSDNEIRMTRAFAAPRDIVFEAWTRPELVKRWLWAFDWPMTHCEIDLKVGGGLRYVWRSEEKGTEMGLSGVFREIEPPVRIVHTELFDEDWTGGETRVTTLFDERDGRTIVTTTVLYASTEARDSALQTGMKEGLADCYGKLDRFLDENQPA